MPYWIKILLISLIIMVGLGILILSGFIFHAHFNEFNPQEKTLLKKPDTTSERNYEQNHFTLVSWNIGYGGLGKNMDFFYGGGEKVRPDVNQFKKYINGIYKTISSYQSADFLLLQEVDINSKRSYHNDEAANIHDIMPEHHSFFATNYKVPFVPKPFINPLGNVESGIQTLSKFKPHIASKHYFSSSYSWPYRLFTLKRAYLKMVYKLKRGIQLVVYNTHNSAFDDGNLRQVEFKTIRQDMVNEYARGNYVVAGGDWNLNPPEFNPNKDSLNYNLQSVQPKLDAQAIPEGWQWAWDKNIPTNRSNNRPFEKGKNTTTIIDYFIVSPNISIDTVITRNMDFQYSDHQPVIMQITLPENDTTKSSPK